MHKEVMDYERVEDLVKKYGYIRLNLPADERSYQSGNGEGIFAVVTNDEDHKANLADKREGEFTAISCSDSLYYMGDIKYGTEIKAEWRGVHRAVAVFKDLPHSAKMDPEKESMNTEKV